MSSSFCVVLSARVRDNVRVHLVARFPPSAPVWVVFSCAVRARKLRAEMTAAEGHKVQTLEDQKRKKAVELQLARFGIAVR